MFRLAKSFSVKVDLLKAAFLALLFHIALFLLFRIESFFDPNSLPQLPLFSVEIDLRSVTCQKAPGHAPFFVLPVSQQELPAPLDFPLLEEEMEKSFAEFSKQDCDFSELEKIEFHCLLDWEEHDSD